MYDYGILKDDDVKVDREEMNKLDWAAHGFGLDSTRLDSTRAVCRLLCAVCFGPLPVLPIARLERLDSRLKALVCGTGAGEKWRWPCWLSVARNSQTLAELPAFEGQLLAFY